MRLLLCTVVTTLGLTAVSALPSVSLTAGGAPPAGELVDHKFRTPPMNSYGTVDLASLRGRPTLIDFWGTHCPPCVGAAVPGSIKLKEEFGDDLNVIFVESQNTPADETEAFIYRHKWGGSGAFWTQDAPCGMDGNGLPAFVLIGSDGKAITAGYPEEQKIRELVEADLKAFKAIPKDTPPALAAATKDFNKGAYASAILAAKKVAETPAAEDKNGAAARANQLVADWTARVSSRIERLNYMLENGHFAKADAEVLALKPAIKGLADLETKLAEVSAKLSSDDQKLAREAAKAVDSALAKVNDKGLEDKTAKEFARLGEKYSGTRAGERAAHLAKLFEMKVDKNSL